MPTDVSGNKGGPTSRVTDEIKPRYGQAAPPQEAWVERRAQQLEAAQRPHPQKYGDIADGQRLRDGTIVRGTVTRKNGQDETLVLPVMYDQTPDGNIIRGGPYDGRFL